MSSKLATFRAYAFDRQCGRCFYCGLPMWDTAPQQFACINRLQVTQTAPYRSTAERLTARRDGGCHRRDNIVAACWHCNQTRHRRKNPPAPDVWKRIQARRSRKRWERSLAEAEGQAG